MPRRFPLNPGWMIILRDCGISAERVLQRAKLPTSLLAQQEATITADEYCAIFASLEAEAPNKILPIVLTEAVSFESFEPQLLAAMCSSHLNAALLTLARFKTLISPLTFDVAVGPHSTEVKLRWTEPSCPPPFLVLATDLAFLTRLARLGTRTELDPIAITSSQALKPQPAFQDYFGVTPKVSRQNSIAFSAVDAMRPFVTARQDILRLLEPELSKQLDLSTERASARERARLALLELLPGGRSSVDDVARKIGMSARSLQRNIRRDGTTFQKLLNQTREELARHYLQTTTLSGTEIAYLLGYDNPNSFFRAFQGWTGATPMQVRLNKEQSN